MYIKFIYTIFIGVLLATFVGVGIAAFYPQPKYPEYSEALRYPTKAMESEPTEEMLAEQKRFDQEQKKFQQTINGYNRNVSIISLVIAVATLVVSLTLFKKILLIADGLLLGGVLTLLYSIGRGFATDDNMFRFVVVAVGLTVSLILGYIKFIKSSEAKR